MVINIDDTIAITQNFTNKGNFERVWRHFRRCKKKSACNWLRNMKKGNKELFDRAIQLNKTDGFKMYDQVVTSQNKWPYSRTSSMTESSEELSELEFNYDE